VTARRVQRIAPVLVVVLACLTSAFLVGRHLAASRDSRPALAMAPGTLADRVPAFLSPPSAREQSERLHAASSGEPFDAEGAPDETVHCEASTGCGLGKACVHQRCVDCATDEQCRRGETCAKGRCLPPENVSCRTDADCASTKGATCVLTGSFVGWPGNRNLLTTCRTMTGSAWPPRSERPLPDESRPASYTPSSGVPNVNPQDLIDSL
jgi:hypothetical protein